MSTIMDLSRLPTGGASPELCRELQQGRFEVRASKDEAVVFGSDGARLFRVTKDGVDYDLLKGLFTRNTALQSWVGECRTTARENSGNCNTTRDYDASSALLPFRGANGKVRIKIEKRHDGEKGHYEKHAAYTPYASVNPVLYRLCCIAMEQFQGPRLADTIPELVQVAPELRYSEKAKGHVPTPAKPVVKQWSDAIVYSEPKVETVAPKCHHKHHKH